MLRTLAVLMLLPLAACLNEVSAAQVDASDIRCGNKGPYYGQTDGHCLNANNKGPVGVVSGSAEWAFNSSLMVNKRHEFLGDFIVPDVDSDDAAQDGWMSQDVATAGCPAQKADWDDGALEMLLDNGSEVGSCSLYWGDESNIDSDKGPVCIFRLQIQTAPAAADTLSWGFMGAYAAIAENTANNAMFQVAGADLNLDISTDDASTDDDLNDTGVDLVADTYYEFKVSMSAMDDASPTDVRFFYRSTLAGDWTRLLSGTTFAYGADIATQPFVHVEKTTGATVPDLLVDYVNCYWERS
jgi:hypothetical protein